MDNFYKNKTILITGTTGFKGSWLAFWLNNLGAKVIGYALKPDTTPNNFEILNIKNKINQVYGDINDLEKLNKVTKKYKPEIIFHLAAQPLVIESYKDPIYTFQTNAIGTANIMEITRLNESIKGVVVVTTDKVYKNKESKHSYKETDELGGFDPYSTSKTMSEFVVNSYTNSFLKQLGKKICTLRAGNVIGGGDWVKYRLIPDIVRSVYEKNKLKIRNPHSIRPWQYVLEAIYGYLIVGKKMFEDDKYIGAYNFGPDIDDNIKVIDVVKNSVKILGKGNFEISKDFANFHEAGLLLLDNTKAKSLLGRTPKYKIKEALKRTFNWYKIYYNNQDIEKLSLKEINDFNF